MPDPSPTPVVVSDALAATPGALTKLGCAMMASGLGAKASAIVARMTAEHPGDPEMRNAARVILAHGVPQWHVSMLADGPRNDGYEKAIGRAVSSDLMVLDIGTGSGLLAMMAARAGAGHVFACEAHPAIAATAREIVALNGLSQAIEIVAKHSDELSPEHDLRGGADLIVSEVFSEDLIGEGALATIEDAMRRLARPGARIIPAAATIRIALCWHDRQGRNLPGEVKGFDLSPFSRHVTPHYQLRAGDKRLELRSEACDLFDFDFQASGPFPAGRREVALASSGGRVNGVVQWIRLQLDECEAYENKPGEGAASHWAALFHPLAEPIETRKGQSIGIAASHDRERLSIWFSEP